MSRILRMRKLFSARNAEIEADIHCGAGFAVFAIAAAGSAGDVRRNGHGDSVGDGESHRGAVAAWFMEIVSKRRLV